MPVASRSPASHHRAVDAAGKVGKALRGACTRGPAGQAAAWSMSGRPARAWRWLRGRLPIATRLPASLEASPCSILTAPLSPSNALHCRPDTAQAIRDRKGYYVLATWSNCGRLFKFSRPSRRCSTPPGSPHERAGEGLSLTAASSAMRCRAGTAASKTIRFPAIAAVGRVDSWRANAGRIAKHTVRYCLPRARCRPRSCPRPCTHWGIENNRHCVLDVPFDEDARRSRKDNAAENLAIIRKLALNDLHATPGPARTNQKMLQARWKQRLPSLRPPPYAIGLLSHPGFSLKLATRCEGAETARRIGSS
ncbi:putative transposase YbfD/YdcC [Bradyrhizobium sp. USDA 4461]